MNDLKNYRERELKYYAMANMIIVFLSISDVQYYVRCAEQIQNFSSVLLESTGISILVYLIAFIVDSLYSSRMKSWLLLYFRNSRCKCFKMPGELIFIKLKQSKDPRFEQESINLRYKNIYELMPCDFIKQCKFQNHKFYELFHAYENKPRVRGPFIEYLLCRDLVALTFTCFLFVSTLWAFNIVDICSNIFYFYFFAYIILVVCARNKAKRYVSNVIAEDLYSKELNENIE